MKTSLRWKSFVSPGWEAADGGNSFHYHPLNAWVRRALFSIKLVDNNAPCLQKSKRFAKIPQSSALTTFPTAPFLHTRQLSQEKSGQECASLPKVNLISPTWSKCLFFTRSKTHSTNFPHSIYLSFSILVPKRGWFQDSPPLRTPIPKSEAALILYIKYQHLHASYALLKYIKLALIPIWRPMFSK